MNEHDKKAINVLRMLYRLTIPQRIGKIPDEAYLAVLQVMADYFGEIETILKGSSIDMTAIKLVGWINKSINHLASCGVNDESIQKIRRSLERSVPLVRQQRIKRITGGKTDVVNRALGKHWRLRQSLITSALCVDACLSYYNDSILPTRNLYISVVASSMLMACVIGFLWPLLKSGRAKEKCSIIIGANLLSCSTEFLPRMGPIIENVISALTLFVVAAAFLSGNDDDDDDNGTPAEAENETQSSTRIEPALISKV